MDEWYHSGLEAYCKGSARLLDEGSPDLALIFCSDLLPDRTRKNLTHAWTLSNVRRGRNNRLSLFEKQWLGGSYASTYIEEAHRLYKIGDTDGHFDTIPSGSNYERILLSTTDKDEREHVAIVRCETDAVEACVDHVLALLNDIDATAASGVASLVMKEDFPIDFFTYVMPAIEQGLLSERYRPSDVQQFSVTLSSLIREAHDCLIEDVDGSGLEPFRAFLVALFAGVVYGPSHPLALGRPGDATPTYAAYNHKVELEGTTIRLTQVFDERTMYTGYSELFRPSQVVFFGRCPEARVYENRCSELFGADADIQQAIIRCEHVVYPIALHDAVSNVHGMLLCEDDVWRLYDLGSTNGTSVRSIDDAVAVNGLVEVRPGDRIRLGAPATADDTNVYWNAAVLLVSLDVNRAEEYVD